MTCGCAVRLAALVARIDHLEARVVELEQEVAQRRPRRLPAVDDWTFLKTITIVVGDRVFSSADLIAFARVDDQLRAVLGAANDRRIGWRLAQLRGRVLHGFVLTRVKRGATGYVWAVLHTRDGVEA